MDRQHYQVGDLIHGGHRVLAIHTTELAMVYICKQDLSGGKPVFKAIKTFRLSSDVSHALFERELVNWVSIPRHPNIVQAKDADTIKKLLFLEFVPGPNLRNVAWKCPAHPRHFLQWSSQIAKALRFLHKDHHFIHRDIRPTNILIDTAHELTAKISDLGIGKPYDAAAAEHTIIGAFAYMAPEVYDGRTDYRSDIFSFGATLYFLLTGSYAAKLSTQSMDQVISPSELVPAIPESVSAWVLKCLEKDQDRRYQTMDEVIEASKNFREWPIDSMPFEQCPLHAYSYYSASSKFRCPFCVYIKNFQKREEELKRFLKKKSTSLEK
jgi:serine/threonine protein kinase